jgi:hypothetical protein
MTLIKAQHAWLELVMAQMETPGWSESFRLTSARLLHRVRTAGDSM